MVAEEAGLVDGQRVDDLASLLGVEGESGDPAAADAALVFSAPLAAGCSACGRFGSNRVDASCCWCCCCCWWGSACCDGCRLPRGTDAVAVAYGAHPPEQLGDLRPLTIAHSVPELQDWLARHG